jgi:hypothetical protein
MKAMAKHRSHSIEFKRQFVVNGKKVRWPMPGHDVGIFPPILSRMHNRATKVRWIFSILFLALVSLFVADIIGIWLRKYHYETTESYVRGLSSLARMPWAYPAMLVFGGLSAGAWLEWLLRTKDSSKAAKMQVLGLQLVALGESVKQRQHYGETWPNNIDDLRPRITSAFFRVKEFNIWTPEESVFNLPSPSALINYLGMIGTLLSDGHFSEAYKNALVAKRRMLEEMRLPTASVVDSKFLSLLRRARCRNFKFKPN